MSNYVDENIKQLEKTATDFKLIESSKTEISSNVAQKIVNTSRQGTYTMKFLQIFTIKDGVGYIITYTATLDTYDDYYPAIERMIKSFRIC